MHKYLLFLFCLLFSVSTRAAVPDSVNVSGVAQDAVTKNFLVDYVVKSYALDEHGAETWVRTDTCRDAVVRYPTYAMEKNITGHVILRFVVEKDGSIGPINVVNSLEERCDAEAILAVSKLGKFIPAHHQGQPVRSYCTLPVSFRLN